jgi:hypothetical protein
MIPSSFVTVPRRGPRLATGDRATQAGRFHVTAGRSLRAGARGLRADGGPPGLRS